MFGTNRNCPWDKPGPVPGTNWPPSLGQTGRFLFNSTVKSPSCPACPWDGWGFVPGTIVPQGRSEKCLCVFCLLVFFRPHCSGQKFSLEDERITCWMLPVADRALSPSNARDTCDQKSESRLIEKSAPSGPGCPSSPRAITQMSLCLCVSSFADLRSDKSPTKKKNA